MCKLFSYYFVWVFIIPYLHYFMQRDSAALAMDFTIATSSASTVARTASLLCNTVHLAQWTLRSAPLRRPRRQLPECRSLNSRKRTSVPQTYLTNPTWLRHQQCAKNKLIYALKLNHLQILLAYHLHIICMPFVSVIISVFYCQ